jgi:hypothetical protein
MQYIPILSVEMLVVEWIPEEFSDEALEDNDDTSATKPATDMNDDNAIYQDLDDFFDLGSVGGEVQEYELEEHSFDEVDVDTPLPSHTALPPPSQLNFGVNPDTRSSAKILRVMRKEVHRIMRE